MKNSIELTRINNDTNGNPRYVCHFLALTDEKDEIVAEAQAVVNRSLGSISELYAIAVNKAKKIGGRKYHTKAFGGGIVFTDNDPQRIERKILSVV